MACKLDALMLNEVLVHKELGCQCLGLLLALESLQALLVFPFSHCFGIFLFYFTTVSLCFYLSPLIIALGLIFPPPQHGVSKLPQDPVWVPG